MFGRKIAACVSAVALAALLAPAAASAATEVGNECGAEHLTGGFVEVPESIAAGAGTLPLSVPGEGVLTSWKIKSLSASPAPARIGVFRAGDSAGKFQLVGASGEETAGFGPNAFKIRIPVKAGDRFGSIPAGGGYFTCATGNPDDHSWAYNGAVAVGSTYQFAAGAQARVPIVGVVEPDIDGDGFGDETQDACPRSKSTIDPCPLVKTSFTTKVKKKSIEVSVTVSSVATVQVFGQVSWPVRGAPKLPHSSKKPKDHVLIVGISGGRPRVVTPGQPTVFRAQISKPILRRLGRIGPKEALRPLMTARTTDIAGKITDERQRIKLKGREGT